MKKSIILYLFFIISFKSFSQTGTLKGVVMYFFNDNFGDKPDIGSKVYLIKNNSDFYHELNTCIKDDYYKTIDNYKQLISDFERTNEDMSKVLIKIPKDLRNKRKELKSAIEFNEEKLYKYDMEQEYCIKQKLNHGSKNIYGSEIVDGNGTFYFSDLDFDTYNVYIISKQREEKLARIDVNVDKKYQTISYTFKPNTIIIKKKREVDDTY